MDFFFFFSGIRQCVVLNTVSNVWNLYNVFFYSPLQVFVCGLVRTWTQTFPGSVPFIPHCVAARHKASV